MWLAAERRSLRVRLLAIAALAVNLPPTKVSPQCKAAVPVRLKTCECCDHVFRSKRKAERNSMKRMRAVESDSAKSTRKAKDKLHKACERASEIRERTLNRQEQNSTVKWERAWYIFSRE